MEFKTGVQPPYDLFHALFDKQFWNFDAFIQQEKNFQTTEVIDLGI